MDRPEEYAIKQLLDTVGDVKGLSPDDRKELLDLANTVVAEHDRWLHATHRYLRERDRSRKAITSHCRPEGCKYCHWRKSDGSKCDWVQEAIADEAKPVVPHLVILLDEANYNAFVKLLDESTGPNDKLRKLLTTNPPWDTASASEPAQTCSDMSVVTVLDAASADKLEQIIEDPQEPNECMKKLMSDDMSVADMSKKLDDILTTNEQKMAQIEKTLDAILKHIMTGSVK